ncbi:YjaA family stress response protein, partial [Citrobacter youngae]
EAHPDGWAFLRFRFYHGLIKEIPMVILYVQLYKNRVVVRNTTTQQEVSGFRTFSNQRLLIAEFFEAEKLIQDLVDQLMPRSKWRQLFWRNSFGLLAHALEMNEGGLSQVEERAILEVTFGAADGRAKYPQVISGKVPLSDAGVRSTFLQGETDFRNSRRS